MQRVLRDEIVNPLRQVNHKAYFSRIFTSLSNEYVSYIGYLNEYVYSTLQDEKVMVAGLVASWITRGWAMEQEGGAGVQDTPVGLSGPHVLLSDTTSAQVSVLLLCV